MNAIPDDLNQWNTTLSGIKPLGQVANDRKKMKTRKRDNSGLEDEEQKI